MQARLLSLIVATLFTLVSTACAAASINWQPFSNDVFTKAKQEHKQVLVFGKAEWCRWCRKMNDSTYSDSSVAAFVNSHFIAVRVDIDGNANVANTYGISVVPKTIILDQNARTIDSVTGYINSSAMLRFLQSNAK